MLWQWQPISPECFHDLKVLVQILLATILTKRLHTNPYIFPVDDGVITQSIDSVLTRLDKLRNFCSVLLDYSAIIAHSVVLV